jgi:hypothetical protein
MVNLASDVVQVDQNGIVLGAGRFVLFFIVTAVKTSSLSSYQLSAALQACCVYTIEGHMRCNLTQIRHGKGLDDIHLLPPLSYNNLK